MGKALTDAEDARGHALHDLLHGKDGYEITEIQGMGTGGRSSLNKCFWQFDEWPAYQQQAICVARGRVLDVGCGAGRHSIHLQGQGLEVVGIDISPLSITTCRERGLADARAMCFSEIGPEMGFFDTILLLGNNFGIFGTPDEAKRWMVRLQAITSADAVVLAHSTDPQTDDGLKMETIRTRYEHFLTPWFDYFWASKGRMREILAGTGWTISHFFDGPVGTYIAVLHKQSSLGG